MLATCGDGFLCSSGGCTTGPSGGTEQCDNNGANSNVTPDACRTNCANAGCGDNVTDTGEFCDTGGNSISCDANCTAVACGDGFTNPAAGEQCDGGGETAACDPDCTNRVCGDNYINVTAGEECDDGNTTPRRRLLGDVSVQRWCRRGGCQDRAVRTRGELTLLAATGGVCATNGDCIDGSTCDTGIGRCMTETELDTGWTGIAHDADINDQVVVVGRPRVPRSRARPAASAHVVGIEPDPGYCRCAQRQPCDLRRAVRRRRRRLRR